MTKLDKKQKKETPLIQISARRAGGKKKPDLFASFKKEHPLDELLPDTTLLDSSGRPTHTSLDDQTKIIGRPNSKTLDDMSSKKQVWTTKDKPHLDDMSSKKKTLDDQKQNFSGNWAKYENARGTDRLGLRPNKEILRKFKVFCAEKGLTLTEFFEISGIKFIDLDDQSKSSLDDMSPYDDRRMMITWKTKVHIINLYLRYNSILNTKSKWTVRDDEKSFQLNEVDSKVIELGIIQTQFQKNFKGKINSFSYYLNEIDNFKELGMSGEVLNTMLKINRQRWHQATGRLLDYSEFENKSE
jgi:hypothetical protein